MKKIIVSQLIVAMIALTGTVAVLAILLTVNMAVVGSMARSTVPVEKALFGFVSLSVNRAKTPTVLREITIAAISRLMMIFFFITRSRSHRWPDRARSFWHTRTRGRNPHPWFG